MSVNDCDIGQVRRQFAVVPCGCNIHLQVFAEHRHIIEPGSADRAACDQIDVWFLQAVESLLGWTNKMNGLLAVIATTSKLNWCDGPDNDLVKLVKPRYQ